MKKTRLMLVYSIIAGIMMCLNTGCHKHNRSVPPEVTTVDINGITSKNAVLIQVWTALITIVLLTVLKSKAKYNWHMSNLVVFIRLNLYIKIDLFRWMDNPFWPKDKSPPVDRSPIIIVLKDVGDCHEILVILDLN